MGGMTGGERLADAGLPVLLCSVLLQPATDRGLADAHAEACSCLAYVSQSFSISNSDRPVEYPAPSVCMPARGHF